MQKKHLHVSSSMSTYTNPIESKFALKQLTADCKSTKNEVIFKNKLSSMKCNVHTTFNSEDSQKWPTLKSQLDETSKKGNLFQCTFCFPGCASLPLMTSLLHRKQDHMNSITNPTVKKPTGFLVHHLPVRSIPTSENPTAMRQPSSSITSFLSLAFSCRDTRVKKATCWVLSEIMSSVTLFWLHMKQFYKTVCPFCFPDTLPEVTSTQDAQA